MRRPVSNSTISRPRKGRSVLIAILLILYVVACGVASVGLLALLSGFLSFLAPNDFAASYWPSFLSTVMGIIAGIPFAIVLSAITNDLLEERSNAQKKRLLIDSLGLLGQNIQENQDFLALAYLSLSGNNFLSIGSVNSSAWEALKPTLIENLSDPELLSSISKYFNTITVLAKGFDLHRDVAIARLTNLGSNVQGQDNLIKTMRIDLLDVILKAQQSGAELHAQIEQAVKTL